MLKAYLWNVWRVTYGTYADVARDGDTKPVLVQRDMSFDHARRLVDRMGFGFCMKPREH